MKPYIVDSSSPALSHDIADYPDGIVIPIDKPYRWTSADVIRKVKYAAIRHFGKKNLKVGHAGTLDPLATGIVLVCIGNATKLAEEFQSHDKEYVAGVTFGATTPSYDLEKEIDRFFPYEHITEQSIREALSGFIGEQNQVAPLFSAKNVDGVRAYELARKLYRQQQSLSGTTPDAESRFDSVAESLLRVSKIRISDIELLNFTAGTSGSASQARHCEEPSVPSLREAEGDVAISSPSTRINVADISNLSLPQAETRIECSKGTYIRALARDLGEALGSGAFLHSLRRTRSGSFNIDNAVSVDFATTLL